MAEQATILVNEQVIVNQQLVNADNGGVLMIADVPAVTPGQKKLFRAGQSGTYTNAGGLVVDLNGKIVDLYYDGTTWSKVEVAMPTLSTALNPNATNKSETGKSVADFVESLAFPLKTTEGVNLFDKGKGRFQGYIDTTTGLDEAFANSEISPWISVDGGEIYNLSGRNLEAAFNVVFKDANGAVLKPQNKLGVEFSNFNVGVANLVLKSPETAVAVKFQVKFNGVGTSENVKFEKGNRTLFSKFAEKSKDLLVKFSNGSYYLRSNFSHNNDIRLKIQKSGGNNLFNLTEAKLLGLNDTVNSDGLLLNGASEDDIAPIKINDTYIGANHGVPRALTITANGHGKTLADVGSKWTDADGQLFYLLKVINTNQLLVMSSNRGAADNTWDFKQGVSSPLTHHSGAVNTSSISSNSGVLSQLYPAVKNLSQKVFADGKEINREGDYSADLLCFTETYDIIDTPDMLEKLFTNRPSGGYTTQPDFTNGDSLITINLTYTFRKGLSCVIDWNFIVRKSLKFNYFGAVQSEYSKPQWVSNIMRKYPNSLPISDGSTSWDFNTPKEISGNFASEMNLTSAYWKNANYPVIRSVDNLNATIKSVSFNIGYLPEFSQNDRKSQVNNAWYLYTSKKQYPYAVDNKIGSILSPNTYRSGSAFRGWSERIGNRFNSLLINKGNKSYLYLDYTDAMADEIAMPIELIGKKINVLQSENLTVLSDVVTEKLNVISSGNAFADIELL